MRTLRFLEITRSVLASAIGIQSDKNRIKDFEKGSPVAFIIAGFLGAVLFVWLLYWLVKTVVFIGK